MKKIDKIFCLCCSDYPQREIQMQNLFDYLNLSNVYYMYTCLNPLNNFIFSKCFNGKSNFNFCDDDFIGGRWFSCTYNHYNIIKLALNKNYDNILVFEDDAYCIVDKNTFLLALDNIPNDADIVKFDFRNNIYTSNEEFPTKDKKFNINNPFIKKTHYCSSMAYYINKKAMKCFIDYMDSYFRISDIALGEICDKYNLNMYMPTFDFFTSNPK